MTYVLDDGPGTTGVLAVDSGNAAVQVDIAGLVGRDTEGLAVAPCDADTDRSCLYVGDIGNNQQAWHSIQVWRIPEPALDSVQSAITVAGEVATYTYPGEPVDAEALLVEAGRPFLVTKERPAEDGADTPPRLLGADGFNDGQLRDFGALALPEPATGGLAGAFFGNVVTGGEAVGGLVVLRTYDHVLVYTPPTPRAALSTLGEWEPREIQTPALGQAEAVTADHCGLWLVSEGVDSVWLVPANLDATFDEGEEQVCPTGSAPSSPAPPAGSVKPSPAS